MGTLRPREALSLCGFGVFGSRLLWGHTVPVRPPCPACTASRGEKGDQDVLGGMNRGPGRLAAFVGAAAGFALLCSLWAGVASAAKGTAVPGRSRSARRRTTARTASRSTSRTPTARRRRPSPSSAARARRRCTAAAGNWTITEDLSSGLWTMVSASTQPDIGAAHLDAEEGRGRRWPSPRASRRRSRSSTRGRRPRSRSASGPRARRSSGASSASPSARRRSRRSRRQEHPERRLQRRGVDAARDEADDHRVGSGRSRRAGHVRRAATPRSSSSKNGVVKVTAGAGANIVYFDNEPAAPPQIGLRRDLQGRRRQLHVHDRSVHVHDHRSRPTPSTPSRSSRASARARSRSRRAT